MTLNELILQTVQENSGGLKLMKLVTDVLVWMNERPTDITDATDADIPNLLYDRVAELEAAGTLGTVKYAFPMGGETVREKQFIFFPLDGVGQSHS